MFNFKTKILQTIAGILGVKVHVYTGEVLGDPLRDEVQGS